MPWHQPRTFGKKSPSLNKNWGTVGLLINPNLEETKNLEIIKKRWTKIYSAYNLNPYDYSIEEEPEIIDENGFLKMK